MNPEVLKERLDTLFSNRPPDNIERLPEAIQEVIDDRIEGNAELFLMHAELTGDTRAAICGAIGQAFFAGHEYAVKYGNLNAEMMEE